MKKSKYFFIVALAIGASFIYTSGAYAQNGGNHHNRGGESRNNERHYNQSPNYGYTGNGNRGYYSQQNYHRSYYPYYHQGYHPNYGYGSVYNYYPVYHYRPIYTSPYAYAHYGPAFGLRISILPFGYYPFYIGNDPFYYYQGIYYRPYGNGEYVVTAPPLGATVKHLPAGAKATVINGQKYYELGGTFYQEEMNEKNKLQYVVVGTDGVINTVDLDHSQSDDSAAPGNSVQGAILNQLPANSKAVVINQQKYYMSPSGVYYQEVIDDNNNVNYKVVGGDGETTNVN